MKTRVSMARSAWCLAALLSAWGCDGDPAGPDSRVQPGYPTTEYTCTVSVRTGATRCHPSTFVAGAGGPQLNILPGEGALTFVNSWVHSAGNPANEDTSTTTLRITNNMGQAIGTTDGVTAHSDGNRLFFATAPHVTEVYSGSAASATIRFTGTDGTASFNSPEGTSPWANRPYYQYNGIVAHGATSSSRQVRFIYSSNVAEFAYTFRVSTPVRYEYGWIGVTPATPPVMHVGEETGFWATVYNAFGVPQWDGITWSSSNPAVATVNAGTGEVTGVATGTATITATSNVNAQRVGARVVRVDAAPVVTGSSPMAGDSATAPLDSVVISFSEPVIVSASSFALACPAGSPRTFTVSGSGTGTITLHSPGALPAGTCTVTVFGGQVNDADVNDGPDLMPDDFTFSFVVVATPSPTGDVAPTVTGSTPADGATAVAPDANIVVTFSEPVIVSVNSFLLECPVSYESLPFTVSGSGTSTITLNPDEDLPEQTCTVTVAASVVVDADANDGPDVMELDHVFSFTVASGP